MRHKLWRSTLISSFILTLGLGLGVTSAKGQVFLSMGGGSRGAPLDTFGLSVGDILWRGVDGFNLSLVKSGGSLENLRRIHEGEMDMGVAFAGDVFLSYNGEDVFTEDGPYDDIRVIGFLYSAVSQLVTLEETGITSVEDLAGKSVAVGVADSGTKLTIERLLTMLGIYNEVTPVLVAGLDASEELKTQQVQAYHALYGVPSETVDDTSSTNEAVILNTYDAAEAAGFFEKYPFYTKYVIPAGTFSGVDEDVTTFRDAGLWVIFADIDEELVYQMTKEVYSQVGLYFMQELAGSVAQEMGPDTALVGVQTPLHPGAARYWREIGVEIPEAAQPR